jgi:hypothetical protein
MKNHQPYVPAAHYELNCGQPILFIKGKPSTPPMDSVAICYEVCDDGMIIRHKHGDPESVRKWAENSKAKLLQLDDPVSKEMADGILIAEISSFPPGSFPLEDINEAIEGNQSALRRLVNGDRILDVESRFVEDRPKS